MPRTKINRNVVNNKRMRENTADLEEILRDYDIEVENSIALLQSKHNQGLREIDSKIDELKRSIPAHILSMKLCDVFKLKDFTDVCLEEKMTNLNVTVMETVQKADEGYLTEERSLITSASESEIQSRSIYKNTSVIGTMKSRRRSKSVSNLAPIPGPRALASASKATTPLNKQPTVHASRSKYRTPLTGLRKKAMSADRIGTITPKVNPANPFSMLRHARAGEAVFSVTGSPIVASNVVEQTANVNIPIADGILSIRPQHIDPHNLDSAMIRKIDQNTFNHLRTLKTNLDILMAGFNRNFKH